MTIPRDTELEILRLVDTEKLAPGSAASLVGVHHDVVDRVVEQAVTGRPERAPRSVAHSGDYIPGRIDAPVALRQCQDRGA